MLIQAPIQKKNIQGFFLFFGGFGKARVGCFELYSIALVYIFYPLKYTALLSYAVHFTEKFYKYIYVVSMHSNSIPWTH